MDISEDREAYLQDCGEKVTTEAVRMIKGFGLTNGEASILMSGLRRGFECGAALLLGLGQGDPFMGGRKEGES